ncbi:MAG TPA: hypothetical protein PLA50_04515 [Bacteroidia bacterium]|nr:hypothetical protein [Bacteroidia bacterium]
MHTYRFLLGAKDVCSIGLESCKLDLRAGGPDSLSLVYERSISGTPPHAVHDVLDLTLQTIDEEGEVATSELLFRGRVVSCPAHDDGRSSGWNVRAVNAWGDMDRIVLTQSWKSWDPVSESLFNRDCPRVTLHIGEDGLPQTTGDTIRDIVGLAASKGAIISTGTISPALTVPPTEVLDTTCLAALRQCLAYHPDHVAWMEGQALHVRPPEALPTVTVHSCSDGLVVTRDPQSAEIPGGVVILWERTHDHDGVRKVERIEQSAGSTGGWPPPMRMTIPLAGVSSTSVSQVIETRTLPVPGQTSAEVAKKFFMGLIPQIGDADVADLLISSYEVAFADPRLDELDAKTDTVNPNRRPISRGSDEPGDFPRMLVNGQIQPWFPTSVKAYSAVLKATIHYKGSNAKIREFTRGRLEVAEPITITNAKPKTYTALDSVTLAEQPIPGLAASYWAAINRARDEGTVSGPLANRWAGLRPGRRVLVLDRFATPAVVSQTSIDCLAMTFSATYGSSEYLNPKSIAELARAMARNRPAWKRPEERTQAQAGGGAKPIREGSNQSPQFATPRVESRLWGLTVTDPEAGKVRIENPGTVKRTAALDNSGLVTVSAIGSEFTVSVGDMLVLEVSPTLSTTLKKVSTWDGWPYPIDTQETSPPGRWVIARYYYVLWDFVGSSSDLGAVKIKDGLWGERRGFEGNLQFLRGRISDKDGHVVSYYELVPSQGCRSGGA